MFNIKVRGAPPVSIHLVIFIKTDVFYHFGSLSPVLFFKREVLLNAKVRKLLKITA